MAISHDDMELEQIRASIDQMSANVEHMRVNNKLAAETAKLGNEALKIQKEIKWYEIVIIVGMTATVIGATAAFTEMFL